MEALVIITILTLNLLVIFAIKSRVNMAITVITSNLAIILLYCLIIDNFLILKELTIATIIYSIVISFLVSKNNNDSREVRGGFKTFLSIILTLFCLTCVSYMFININDQLITQKEDKINSQILKSALTEEDQTTNDGKFKYLYNVNSKNSVLFNRFGEFLIITFAVITFLFLGIKHRRE